VAAVADPDEGVAADGTIRTGAHRGRVPAAFEPVLTDAVAFAGKSGASLYVYGSVATGTARPGSSDVDLLSIGLPDAAILGRRLSARYADRCRGVEVAAATAADFAGGTDAAYGYRVFLRHYCVHLAGPDPSAALSAFPADARAARGFNGDLGEHLWRWRRGLESGTVAADLLGVRAARKTLLAVAGLVSVHDHTWTTDRARAVRRWSDLEPGLAAPLGQLHSWADGQRYPSREEVGRALADEGIVSAIVERFGRLIGLWTDDPEGQ
jgi:Nucleotidyltransferase domain